MGRGYINCCGIDELDGICSSTPEEVLMHFLEDKEDRWGGGNRQLVDPIEPFLFFSDNTRKKEHGREMAAFIKKHCLGKVTRVGTKVNYNSGNKLAMWTFMPDRTALKKWYAKNRR